MATSLQDLWMDSRKGNCAQKLGIERVAVKLNFLCRQIASRGDALNVQIQKQFLAKSLFFPHLSGEGC